MPDDCLFINVQNQVKCTTVFENCKAKEIPRMIRNLQEMKSRAVICK